MWYDKVNKKRVFGCLILNDDIDSLPHGKYFKIKLEDQIFLYRRVGVINVKFNVNNKPKTVSRSVYIPIPKGGMHVGRQHQYEFYVDEHTPSIFQENQLPSTFKYSTIYENVIKPFVLYQNLNRLNQIRLIIIFHVVQMKFQMCNTQRNLSKMIIVKVISILTHRKLLMNIKHLLNLTMALLNLMDLKETHQKVLKYMVVMLLILILIEAFRKFVKKC